MILRTLALSTLILASASLSPAADPAAPETLLLWPKGAPGSVGDTPADQPRLHIHKPAPGTPATSSAVIICPGGGYGTVVMSYEGHEAARWFAARGITALVLEYRIAPRYRHPAPLQDLRRSIRTVRSLAADWKIDPDKIGVFGFSAGGHLAASSATNCAPDLPSHPEPDAIDLLSAKPNFAILAYGVLSLTQPHTHPGSRRNLLGDSPSPDLIKSMSPDENVTPDSPPTFLFHTGEDKVVPAENATGFYAALRKAGVPAELHIFPEGPHGVGLDRHPATSSWPSLLESWLTRNGHLK